jgi:hypothetical protein
MVTRSVTGCIPTQSMGTIRREGIALLAMDVVWP